MGISIRKEEGDGGGQPHPLHLTSASRDGLRPLSPQTIEHCQPPKKEFGTTFPEFRPCQLKRGGGRGRKKDGRQWRTLRSGYHDRGTDLGLDVVRQIIATAASPPVNIRTKIGLLSEITSVEIWDLSGSAPKRGSRTAERTGTGRPIRLVGKTTYTSDSNPARGDPPFF